MKNRIMILAMVAVTLLFAGCQKEDVLTNGQLKLKAEGYGFNTKVAVDGGSSVWVTGDSVLINGDTALVQVSGSEARVSGLSPITSPFYGVYPARICSEYGATCTLNIPAQYTYAVSDGKQVLRSPMVAYASSGNELYFKHVTAAIGVQVVNYYGFTIEVDSIVVVSDSYKLNGSVSVALSGSDPTVTATAAANEAQKKVKMVGGSSLRVFAGDSIVVQIPVLPVGSGNHFTVRTYVHKVDQTAVEKTLEKTQTTGGALARAKIGYARMATPGLFSVSASKKVVISQGNLQYVPNTSIWSFAEHQYDVCEYADNLNGVTTTFTSSRYSASGTNPIDLFGWGTSGAGGTTPYNNSTTYEQYGPSSVNQNIVGETYGEYDWGVKNAISNGGNRNNMWCTLAKTEWEYLLSSGRSDATNKYGFATVAGKYGIIILPDSFTDPQKNNGSGSFVGSGTTSSWLANLYSEDNWCFMEAAGAVFLPATQFRVGKVLKGLYKNLGEGYKYYDAGFYWSTTSNSTKKAYYMNFTGSGATPTFQVTDNDRYYGYAVRLVRVIK